jgi:hypothetical protein
MIKQLCQETNTKSSDWEEVEGPEAGVGVERWYFNEAENLTAYCVNDQGVITIEITDEGGEMWITPA